VADPLGASHSSIWVIMPNLVALGQTLQAYAGALLKKLGRPSDFACDARIFDDLDTEMHFSVKVIENGTV